MSVFETTRFLVKFRDRPASASLRFSAHLGMSGARRHLYFRAAVSQHRRHRCPGSRRERRRMAARNGLGTTRRRRSLGPLPRHSRRQSGRGRGRTGPCPAMARRRSGRYGTKIRCGPRRGASARHRRRLRRRRGRQLLVSQQQSQPDRYARSLQTSGGARVRIAHLDTGYDPDHKSLPKNFRKDLARNFVDADKPKDATDRSEGTLFNNFSHGCGTLSILAGATVPGLKPFGCAPDAEIVPVRVANRVVLFSNSSIAQGLRLRSFPSQLGGDAR